MVKETVDEVIEKVVYIVIVARQFPEIWLNSQEEVHSSHHLVILASSPPHLFQTAHSP
jgi:hypothetical protein